MRKLKSIFWTSILWTLILWTLILWTFFVQITGCSCEYQAKRLFKKCPELLIKKDTVIHDTIITRSVDIDSVFWSRPGDTVKIDTGSYHIRYVRHVDNSNYIGEKVTPDTIIRNNSVYITQLAPYQHTRWERIYKAAFWSIIPSFFLMLLLLLAFLRGRNK